MNTLVLAYVSVLLQTAFDTQEIQRIEPPLDLTRSDVASLPHVLESQSAFPTLNYLDRSEQVMLKLVPDGNLALTDAESSLGILSKSKIELNAELIREGSSVRTLNSSLINAKANLTSVPIELPGRDQVSLVTNRLSNHLESVEVYTGVVEEFPETSWFSIAIEAEKILGYINIEYMQYVIEYEPSIGAHIVSEIDLKLMPHDNPDPIAQRKEKQVRKYSNSTPIHYIT